MTIGVGVLVATSALAQQISNETQTDNKSAAKPYVVVVYGAVISPARFELRRRVRLMEMLRLAGGPTWWADGTIQLIHLETPTDNQTEAELRPPSEVHSLDELIRDDEKANPYVGPGDLVIVQEAPAVYVIGSVVQPTSLPLRDRDRMTLTRALAMAGGPSVHAKTAQIVIYRRTSESSSRLIQRFDLKAIIKHRADDPILQPYDVIEVPPCRGIHPNDLNPIFDSRPLATQLRSRVIG